MRYLSVALTLLLASVAYGQKLTVKIVDRHDSESSYSYQVPAHYSSTTTANANCFGSDSVSCSGHATTNGYATGEHQIAYSVRGATLSLLLPDGRLAIVNCTSKYKLKMDYINRRGCRTPLVDEVEVDFKGKEAKLEWIASIDGKKKDSETYRIVGILPAQK